MRRFFGFLVLAVALATLGGSLAGAHVTERAGDLTVSLGWRDEPAFATLPNAVELTVVDAAGEPVVDPRADLSVAVGFGEATSVRPLLPREPGRYRADLVPTQPGEYSLHVTGTVAATPVDLEATCSDTTFECVAGADEIQFPTAGEGAAPTAGTSDESSDSSALAVAAIVLGAVAIAVAVVSALATRRAGSRRAS